MHGRGNPDGPVDLRKQLGRRYRVEHEESHRAEYGPHARVDDPWLMIIPCRYGHVFPHDCTTLAASVDGFPKVAGRLRRLACCQVHQDGDFGELTVLFEVADFPEVAKIMRPRRRRQLSPTERERLRAVGFKKGPQTHVDVQQTARRCVSEGQADQEPVPRQRVLFDL